MTVAEKILRAKDDYDAVYESGYAKGQAEGGSGAYDEGFEAGKKAEQDAFWSVLQNGGERVLYSNAFYSAAWTKEIFNPKFSMHPTDMAGCFFQFNNNGEQVDFVELAKEQDIEFDFSNVTNFSMAFATSGISRLGTVDLAKATENTTRTSSMFYGAYNQKQGLKRIERLICHPKNLFLSTVFQGCKFLEYVGFEGEIADSLDLQWSPKLSRESIESLVRCLSDGASGKTITLSKTAVENAFGSGTETENVLLGSFGNKTENGITFTDNNDGSFSVNGVSEGAVFFEFARISVVANATYQMSLLTNVGTYSGNFFVLAQDSNGIGYDGVTVPTNTETEYVPMCDGYFVLTYETAPSMEYNNMIVTPSVRKSFTWDSLAATKPNWTISLV
jgi:hypothetical protein